MKQYILFLIIVFCSGLEGISIATAQKSIKLEGIIGMEGGELFSYDLSATASGSNEYKGVVKTYALKDKEVLAEVILTVDPNNHTVELKETKILDNTGFKSNVTICLVRATLTYDASKGVLKGPIITQTTGDGVYCAIGNITFMNRNGIVALFEDENLVADNENEAENPEAEDMSNGQQVSSIPKTSVPRTSEPRSQTTEKPVVYSMPVDNTKEITEGKYETFKWNSEELILDIWDDNSLDGDMVSIMHNGKEILSNYILKKDFKRLKIHVGDNELNIIVIKAMNIGGEPPNTAMIQIWDGDKEYKIKAYNDPGKSAEIRITKELRP